MGSKALFFNEHYLIGVVRGYPQKLSAFLSIAIFVHKSTLQAQK